MASTEIRDRRRTLRYRSLGNQADGADEEPRVRPADGDPESSYNKQRLHKVGYFAELMTANEDVA